MRLPLRSEVQSLHRVAISVVQRPYFYRILFLSFPFSKFYNSANLDSPFFFIAQNYSIPPKTALQRGATTMVRRSVACATVILCGGLVQSLYFCCYMFLVVLQCKRRVGNMIVSLLTIGDELCIGQVVNTNAAWLAEQCTMRGWRVATHAVVGDVLVTIVAEMDRLSAASDVVIVTGGLGPTHDDVTKDALAMLFNDTLELNEQAFVWLQDRLVQRGREVTERQKRQAVLPTQCTPLFNEKGTAPGMRLERNGVLFFSLPGVPHEMKHLAEHHVFPAIAEKTGDTATVAFRTLLTAGIIEASLADLLHDAEQFLEGQELAFLPSTAGVRLRIGTTAATRQQAELHIERIERELYRRAGKYIYGRDEDTLASVVGQLLYQRSATLAVAESCTGGLLGAALTDVPGSSAYFLGGIQVYSNEAKHMLLHVPEEVLNTVGAVSKETAELLAANIRTVFGTDVGVSITGVAGPDGGTPDKPVGTVWIAVADADGVQAIKFVFGTDRRINRELSVTNALWMLYKRLRNTEEDNV